MPHQISLVVPCFRESQRLPLYLADLCREMQALGGVKILVVDDGSGETESALTSDLVESLRPEYPCLQALLQLPENLGKGAAIYAGWGNSCESDWLAFVDADGACSAAEVARLIKRIDGDSALFASRVKMLGRQVDRLLKRHLLGRIYATLVSVLLRVPVYDSQCGLKIVPRPAFEKIANRLLVTGFAFDVELMVALLDTGCQILEVPIDWHEVAGGKVNLMRDSWRMAWDIWKIRTTRFRWKTSL